MTLTFADLDGYRSLELLPGYPPNMRTYWSPQDNVHSVLKSLVRSCTQSFVLAMYGYDDDELAAQVDGLLTKPAVFCQITLDSSQAGGTHEAALLAKYRNEMSGNSVAIGRSEKGAIMHRKVMIIDGVWRVSGSTNWSAAGESTQDNELTVVQDAVACAEARRILDIEHDHALKAMAAKAAGGAS